MKQLNKYIGFIENNDALKKFESLLDKLDVLGDGYEIDGLDESYTERDLDMIEKGSGNGYMARVNFIPNPEEILPALLLVDSVDNLPYKGRFTVGNKECELR